MSEAFRPAIPAEAPSVDSHVSVGKLLDALGSDLVTLGAGLGTRRYCDWSGTPGAVPLALIRPRSTADVSRALALCHRLGQPVVIQGGLTGLAGGANLQGGEVALSLERMNAIEEVDVVSGTITVEAGAILQRVQEAADAAGMMFPLDLGARGSCTIGGNLATNAGGNRVIRYGMAREQVLGVEAVLADGTVIGDMHKMIKNNSGYDLKQLLVGSEGTLAVITRATLKLAPRPASLLTAWCGLPDYAAVTRLLHYARANLSGGVSAFEVMWPSYYDYVLEHVAGLRKPLDTRHAYYVLLESPASDAPRDAAGFEDTLAEMLAEGVVENAVIASSHADAARFWAVRDAPAEFPVLMPGLIGFDIGFSTADIGAVADACEALLRARWPDMTTLVYGHLGDGNLHVIAHLADAPPDLSDEVDAAVYELTRAWRGAVSAEHGIGSKKRPWLGHTRDAGALQTMRAIKRALDPAGLLNPGKVLESVARSSSANLPGAW
ncbi:FAD-binding oxidoreductase [Paraburkholderia silvatlantica]|uniref:FAD/FMN-containing dehydrogenase n=1 Tax=Paraburkholderia silvatlantica TaxID=321895 RepID=A0A2V4TRX8_9BURK|nr:FAD-binding oxidoreductase [Paraburkholderia silvatlantica]PYE21182.1 FAD/FMN-containing dehydrogenase [Paraburkholderia silvatlantica]TDQ86677.1 FAD/FMN-containing dehydrogenase [Paraburkholderia silvatlantica]